MGNPFYAPGSIGARSVQSIQKQQVPKQEFDALSTKTGDESDVQSQTSKDSRLSQISQISAISEESNFIFDASTTKASKEQERGHAQQQHTAKRKKTN